MPPGRWGFLETPHVRLWCSQVGTHWPEAQKTSREGRRSREPSLCLDSLTSSPLPAWIVCDFMIHRFCCQKPSPQGNWVSGTDRWRPRHLALMAGQGEPSPQGCISKPYQPPSQPPAQTQSADRLRGGRKMVSLGGLCQSRVLIHSFESVWSLGRKEGPPRGPG